MVTPTISPNAPSRRRDWARARLTPLIAKQTITPLWRPAVGARGHFPTHFGTGVERRATRGMVSDCRAAPTSQARRDARFQRSPRQPITRRRYRQAPPAIGRSMGMRAWESRSAPRWRTRGSGACGVTVLWWWGLDVDIKRISDRWRSRFVKFERGGYV